MFITDEVKANFVYVFEKQEELNGKMAYSLTMLIPKDNTQEAARFDKEIKTAVKAKWETKAKCKEKWGSPSFHNPLRDGDAEGKYEGYWFVKAKSFSTKPKVIDLHKQELTNNEEFFSGCWCRCSLNFVAYEKKGGLGVGVYINNILKVREGSRPDGTGSNPEDDFSDYTKDLAKEEDPFKDGAKDAPAAKAPAAADDDDDWL